MNFKTGIFIILLIGCVSVTTAGGLGLFSKVHLDPMSSCFPVCWH